MSLFPLLALGGAAAVAVKDGKTVEQTQLGSTTQAMQTNPQIGNKLGVDGVTIGDLAAAQAQTPGGTPPKASKISAGFSSLLASRLGNAVKTDSFDALIQTNPNGTMDPAIQEKLDALNHYIEQAYDRLDPSARYEGAQILNQQLNLDPPLTGNEDWETISSVAGGAAGGAVGDYFGGPLGAKLGSIAGAYLGVKIEQFASDEVPQIGDWFKARWNDISDWVGDQASSVASSVGDFFGSIF